MSELRLLRVQLHVPGGSANLFEGRLPETRA